MAKVLKADHGRNSVDIEQLIRTCCDDMSPIMAARENLNKDAADVRQRLKDAGVHIPTFDLALRIHRMEDKAAQLSYQEGLSIAFKALGLGETGQMFAADPKPEPEPTAPAPKPAAAAKKKPVEVAPAPEAAAPEPKEEPPKDQALPDTLYNRYCDLNIEHCRAGELLLMQGDDGEYLTYGVAANIALDAAMIPKDRLSQILDDKEAYVPRISILDEELATKINMITEDGYAVISIDAAGAIAHHDATNAA